MTAPLVVTDNFLTSVLAKPAVLEQFPEIKEMARTASFTKSGCRSCGSKQPSDSTLRSLESFILRLSGPSIDTFKNAAGLSPETKLRMYHRIGGGRIEKVDL